MKREIRILADAAELAQAGAAEFATQAVAAVGEKGIFTVALSGGSTPKSLYSLLATDEQWRRTLPWDKIHFFWGDERHVPPTDHGSNYRMVNEALLSRVDIPAENVHRIKGEEKDARVAADKYQEDLQQFFPNSIEQLPRFDLVLLGLGADGHTASLFPNSPAIQERERLVFANWVESLNSYRLTLTLPVFNNAAMVLFLVSGSEKVEILRAVLTNDGAATYPAQLIQPAKGNLVWLLDGNVGKSFSGFKPDANRET